MTVSLFLAFGKDAKYVRFIKNANARTLFWCCCDVVDTSGNLTAVILGVFFVLDAECAVTFSVYLSLAAQACLLDRFVIAFSIQRNSYLGMIITHLYKLSSIAPNATKKKICQTPLEQGILNKMKSHPGPSTLKRIHTMEKSTVNTRYQPFLVLSSLMSFKREICLYKCNASK